MKNLLLLIMTTLVMASAWAQPKLKPISKPLVTQLFTADPSAHVFNNKIYIYPSHDIDAGIPENDNGDHFDMSDYHIFSMDAIGAKVVDNGVAIDKKDIPWAGRQLWAPDAAYKNGVYYLFFPIKDKQDIFRIGVATSKSPVGPFKSEPNEMKGTYSIDPAVFKDDNNEYYMYFGGIWGGQLQRWDNNIYNANAKLKTANEKAILPRVAKLSADMKSIVEAPKEVK